MKQKCMYTPILFPNNLSILQTADFHINRAGLHGDRLVHKNFVYINRVHINQT